ncbi:hypothetical protein GCM10022140_02850 [Rhodococcus aetherivorans]
MPATTATPNAHRWIQPRIRGFTGSSSIPKTVMVGASLRYRRVTYASVTFAVCRIRGGAEAGARASATTAAATGDDRERNVTRVVISG